MMRQVVFMLMALMLVTGMATAQEKKAVIAVDNAVHDFGKFKEADGNVTHTFVITNQGDAPLVITRVIASCGCTTPVWTKEPIAPGKTGKIDVANYTLDFGQIERNTKLRLQGSVRLWF